MSDTYTPPTVWEWDQEREKEWRFSSHNRPVAGATHEKVLPVGKHPFQLYSLGSPNGVKVTVLLEELLALGHSNAEYDAWMISIDAGDQFGSGFVELNPNSKIPALLDRSGPTPLRVFESGAIILHLSETFGDAFLSKDRVKRAEILSWVLWMTGVAPYLGGGIGHFYLYAPVKIEYAINRYAMEVKREFDVLNRRLGEVEYLAGDEYSLADIAVWPWFGVVAKNGLYRLTEFLQLDQYENVQRWADKIAARPAVQRGRLVNLALPERHSAADIDKALAEAAAKQG